MVTVCVCVCVCVCVHVSVCEGQLGASLYVLQTPAAPTGRKGIGLLRFERLDERIFENNTAHLYFV